MSIGAGALAIKRLHVLAKPMSLSFSDVVNSLRASAISPIDVEETKEEAVGFCHPFTGEPDFSDAHELVYGDAFVFGMRIDSKKIPGTLFRLQLRAALDALNAHAQRAGSGDDARRKRMSKKAKDAAKDRIKEELLRRTLPHIKLTEIIWHFDTNELWIASTSAGVVAQFESLFTETFGLPLVHINPGTLGLDFDRISHDLPVNLKPHFDLAPVGLLARKTSDPSLEDALEAMRAPQTATTDASDLF